MDNLNLSDVKITDYIPTIYTSPRTIHYKQNGTPKAAHIFAERNGVVVVIYNKSRQVLVFVRQFRAAVYVNDIPEEDRKGEINVGKYPPGGAVTLELCAGLEDKNLPPVEIAREEVLEECGYEISTSDLHEVCQFKNGVETTGAISTIYYCEVTDEMKVTSGGGVDGEQIEVVEMTVGETLGYLSQEIINSPPNVLFGIYWFLQNKHKTVC